MEDLDILDLILDVFPWISAQAVILGATTRNVKFGRLGCELFILTQKIPSMSHARHAVLNGKLKEITEIVNKACSWYPKLKKNLGALREILRYKDLVIGREEIPELLRESLGGFVLQNPEFDVLLKRIEDCIALNESPESDVEWLSHQMEDEPSYPIHVNNTLYDQVRMHASCSCATQHLELARLRLESTQSPYEETIPFYLLFCADSLSRGVRWQEAKILVSRKKNSSTSKKEIRFSERLSDQAFLSLRQTPPIERLKRLRIGDFCNLISSGSSYLLEFQVHENALRVMDHFREQTPRDFVPVESISLAKWLEGAPHLSNRVKITLAYTLAKSVWQYYNSSWMTVPWTHENIHLILERGNLSQNTKPHPYFITKLREPEKNVKDFYDAEDLMHMYPNLLALGILLIEIATNQPYKDYQGSYRWDKTVINDYYNWAWTKANKSNLKKSINTVYEGVVDSCLKTDLFEENQFDLSIPPTNSEARQSIIYRKIVTPLKKLFDAYRDDWEIYELQSSLVAPTTKITKDTDAKTNGTRRPVGREEFKIAIVCALPLEADAVRAFLDECWDETGKAYGKQKGDSNAYTTGRMGCHNIVIAHMPRIGKSAAASVAAGIRSSYTRVELAIVVGICGAAPCGPHKNEVLLGDVIISEGLVEYDYGRRYPNDFVRKNTVTGSLGRPSLEIGGILAKIKGVAGRERIEHRINLYINILVKRLGTAKTSYPGIANDKLYESTYRHKHWNSRTCNTCRRCKDPTDSVCEEVLLLSCERAGCQKEKLVRRQRHLEASRDNSSIQPMIHFGLIASGDTVMKSGYDRDNIAIKENVLAFEMEGAGIWDNLPSIIIKGVCDYADSHKSKGWQHYAASTAAACMRAFLDEWPSSGT